MYGSKIVAVIPRLVNLDDEYLADLILNKGIDLHSVDSYTKKGEKIWDGLQSEFFGTDFGDDEAFLERFRCKCGKYVGDCYKGRFCETCETYVGFQDVDLSRFGWIVSNKYKYMHPIYYMKLMEALGSSGEDKVLRKILKVNYENDRDKPVMKEREEQELKKHPFLYKGMIWLYDNLPMVLEFYKKRKPTKKALFEELEKNIDIAFCHAIPVYSAAIRTEVPGEKGGKAFKLKINTAYRILIRTNNAINAKSISEPDATTLISINKALASSQNQLEKIFDITYKETTTKKGIISTKITGGRYNFCARNIIGCSSGRLRADEVELGYITFGELFRYEIINIYSKVMNTSPKYAADMLENAMDHFDPTIYKIMNMIIQDKEYAKCASVLISRNPCINIGSFAWMRVVRVKNNIEDKTMTIPSSICSPANADFDGDMMNIYRSVTVYFMKKFSKTLNPRYNLMISRMDGKVNKECVPFKNECVGFWAFNNL